MAAHGDAQVGLGREMSGRSLRRWGCARTAPRGRKGNTRGLRIVPAHTGTGPRCRLGAGCAQYGAAAFSLMDEVPVTADNVAPRAETGTAHIRSCENSPDSGPGLIHACCRNGHAGGLAWPVAGGDSGARSRLWLTSSVANCKTACTPFASSCPSFRMSSICRGAGASSDEERLACNNGWSRAAIDAADTRRPQRNVGERGGVGQGYGALAATLGPRCAFAPRKS